MKPIHPALNLSPIDSRYYSKVKVLSQYFSEFALVKTRLKVEVEYFIRLVETLDRTLKLSKNDVEYLRDLVETFSIDDFTEIQEIETILNHDVKAVEVFLKIRIEKRLGSSAGELVHFGLTSQDINDVAIPHLLKLSLDQVFYSELEGMVDQLDSLADRFRDIVFVARTHGQPASPSSLGKEIKIYASRLASELDELRRIQHTGKFGGATGNFNAHILAFPNIDWVSFSEEFLLNAFGLVRSKYTTQINNFESKSRVFDSLSRVCGILQDLSQDIWLYLMMGLLTLKSEAQEVGSSAMPHKVNPISFENAEGNLQFASTLFSFLSKKLLVSRLQRDLTDYTLKRNIGLPMSHLLLSIKNLNIGLSKIEPNLENIALDNQKNFIVIAEGVQTILRAEGVPESYNQVKELVRGKQVSSSDLEQWLLNLDVSDDVKNKLKGLSPLSYRGNSNVVR